MKELKELLDNKRIPLFLCIGTMNNTLDSIAPRIGSMLSKMGYNVFGTEDDPLHGLNIETLYRQEICSYPRAIFQHIAIDASRLTEDNKDKDFVISKKSCKPGSGVGHKLPEIGEILIECNTFKYAKERDSKLLTTWGLMVLNHGDSYVESQIKGMAKRFVTELSNILKGDVVNG